MFRDYSDIISKSVIRTKIFPILRKIIVNHSPVRIHQLHRIPNTISIRRDIRVLIRHRVYGKPPRQQLRPIISCPVVVEPGLGVLLFPVESRTGKAPRYRAINGCCIMCWICQFLICLSIVVSHVRLKDTQYVMLLYSVEIGAAYKFLPIPVSNQNFILGRSRDCEICHHLPYSTGGVWGHTTDCIPGYIFSLFNHSIFCYNNPLIIIRALFFPPYLPNGFVKNKQDPYTDQYDKNKEYHDV